MGMAVDVFVWSGLSWGRLLFVLDFDILVLLGLLGPLGLLCL